VLNAIIKEDWWTRLWSDIQFQDVAPDAAIDMSGQYGGGAKKQKIYGSATLNQVVYRGEEVERAFARIWQTPKTLDLFEFSLQTKEGGANVGLHWEYLPNRERNFLSFEARTSMPLEQVARFAAPEVLEYAEMFPTQTTPTLDMVGLIYGETTPNAGAVYFKTSAFFPGAFEFEDIRFANGSFECLLTPDRLDVNNGRFSLGEGRATLAAHLPRAGPELEVQSARIGIADAKLWGLYEAIPFLRESRAKQEQIEARELQTAKGPAPNKPFKEQYAGDVTVWMDARGKPSDLGTFVGNGALSIKNANLGELHLLGGLSKLLANMGIPLGTLKFSNAQSDFTLARSNLFFPDVEITGQTGLINANGNFNIEKETLDFMVTLRPFGNVRAPVLAQIATVFSPVSDLLEVELTGTLHDPEYQVTIQPFSLFTGQRKVANPNADVPAVIPTPVPLDHPQ